MSTKAAKQAKRNGTPIPCGIRGCNARARSRGLCRRHYDVQRHRERNGKNAEAQADVWREMSIQRELELGWVPEKESPPGAMEFSMFGSEKERREAWVQRREQLMAQCDPTSPGTRPEAWWRYEAKRPEHVTEYPLDPLDFESPVDEQADLLDEWEIEPIAWLASHRPPKPGGDRRDHRGWERRTAPDWNRWGAHRQRWRRPGRSTGGQAL